MNSSSPNKAKRPKTKSFKFNEEMSYVPAKLLNFTASPNPKHNMPVLPALTFKPVIHDYDSVVRKKTSEPVIPVESSHLAPLTLTKSPTVSPAKQANDLLFSDRQHTRLDFYKRPTDVSYLLETQKYGKEKNINEFFTKTITRSTNLLSPQRQASLLSKTMQGFRDKKDGQNTQRAELSEAYFTKYEQQKDVLPETLGKLKEFMAADIEFDSEYTRRDTINRSSSRNKSPTRIVDPLTTIHGSNDYFEMKESDIKGGLRKIKEKVVVQHRSQNKNLSIPSGRKEVIVLSDWLNGMLEKIYKEDKVKTDQAFEDVQLIYTACLQELIRQVKIQCAERGQLLDKIWEAYIDLFDRVIKENARATREMENHYLDEIDQIQRIYRMRLDKTLAELEDVKKQRDENGAMLETKREELRFLKKKTDKLNIELKNQKLHVDDVEREMEHVKAENIEMRKLIFESGRHISNRYVEIQKQLEIKYDSRKNKKTLNDQLAGVLFDPMGENISLIDKLEDEFEGKETEENEDDESKLSGDPNEELYKHIGVDTADLEPAVTHESEIVQTTEDKQVQWESEDQALTMPESEPVETEQEKEESNLYRLKLQGQITLEEGALDRLSVLSETEEQTLKIELYDILGSVEKRLIERLDLEDDRQVKMKLAHVLLNLLRSHIGLGGEEYNLLKDKIIEKEGRSPCATEAQIRGRKLSMDIREIDKEGLLDVIEVVKAQLTHKADQEVVKGLDQASNEVFDYIMNILRKKSARAEPVTELEDMIQMEQLSKDTEEIRPLSYANINIRGSDAEESAKLLVENMTPEEKLNLLEEVRKRLDDEIDPENPSGADRELIQAVQMVVEDSSDLVNQDYKSLLKQALSSLNKSIAQVSALKIRIGEQEVDIQELKEIKERYERQMAEMEKELRLARSRVGYSEKQYERLNSRFLKLRSSFEETKQLKLQKLSSLIQHVNKFKNAYRAPRASFSYLDPSRNITEEEVHIKMPISYVEYDNKTIIESKTESVENSGADQKIESVDIAEQFVDNIVTLIKEGPAKDTEEDESWSETDEIRGSESKTKPDLLSVDALIGSIQDIKLLSVNRHKGKKLSTLVGRGMLMPTQPNKMLRVLSVNADSANALLLKVKTSKTVTSGLPKLTILKFISQIYLDRLKASGALRQTPLYIITYDYFINKYGLKKVAESKCQQMFESVSLYKDSPRIQRFRNLLGLGDSYESDDLELYFQTIKLLDPLGNGTIIASNIQDKNLIFAEYAELAATALFEKKIDPQALKKLLNNINQLKFNDKSKSMIEFEDIFDQFLDIQRNLQDKVKRFVKDIFQAADLDSDEIIVFSEFDILYKHLEKERYNDEEVKNLFFAEADLILPDESNERVVSFNRFARICLERGLFSEEKQLKFARVSDPSDDIQNVQDLTDSLKDKLNEIRLRFIKSETYNIHLKGIMTKLYNSIRNPLKPRNVVWLTYRLLDEESKHQLLNYQIRKMLPKELLAINKFMENYEEWSI